jgi:hypothetical protein
MSRYHLIIIAALMAIPASAAPQLKPETKKITSLVGTSWSGLTAEGWPMTIDFMADGKMTVSYNKATYTRASWRQDGEKVYYEMNDKYCEFNGRMAGDTIEGGTHNVVGRKWETKLTRIRGDR